VWLVWEDAAIHDVAGAPRRVSVEAQSVLLDAMPETLKAELHRKLSEPGSGSK
jgi:hypothetical protein